ncbi:MAG: iron ABC transporter permease [Lachnospiraceae bacterium]|nr:iron ABC transporter permease [Lachnospiraceae bacterium]
MVQKFCKLVQKNTGISCVILLLLLVVSLVMCVSIGSADISFLDVWRIIFHKVNPGIDISDIKPGVQNIVIYLRIPRALLGMVVGASLAVSGIAMQAFTKNPLSEPYVLGISSGASVGAVLSIVSGLILPWGTRLTIPVGSFCGAMASILVVYALSRTGGEITPMRLVLVGVAISAICGAMTDFIVYTAPQDAQVREATFWMLGGLGNASWDELPIPSLVLVPSIMVMLLLSRPLNAMMIGDDTAITLGVPIDTVRKVLIFLTALLTSCSVMVSGCIGFVGLIVPHLVRAIVGADHTRLIPLASIFGGLFMIWADVAARLVCRPAELPVGILTALIGGPLFLWMIHARKYSFGR